MMPEIKAAAREFDTGKPVENLVWSVKEKNWVGFCSAGKVQIMKVDDSAKGF